MGSEDDNSGEDASAEATFHSWLEELRDRDDEVFDILTGVMESIQETLSKTHLKKSLASLLSLKMNINVLKNSVFDECGADAMYSAKILYRVFMEHWLKANYILLRVMKEKTDQVGEDYQVFHALEEELKFGNSIRWLNEIFDAQEKRLEPWDVLVKHRPELSRYSKKEVLEKSKAFNYREIAHYLLKNDFPGSNFVEPIITEYAELSSYVHGGPGGMSEIVRIAKNRFDEYKGMARFVFNMNKANAYTTLMAFAAFGAVPCIEAMKRLEKIDWA